MTGNNGQTPNVWTVSFLEDQQNLNGSGVKVSEVKQTGYTYQSLVCQVTPLSGGNVRTVATSNLNTSDGNMVSAVLTSLTPGEKATCTFTNKPDPGSVSWTKTDASTVKRPLKGAEWTIIGPSPATTAISVTDCVANVDSACLSSDKDRRMLDILRSPIWLGGSTSLLRPRHRLATSLIRPSTPSWSQRTILTSSLTIRSRILSVRFLCCRSPVDGARRYKVRYRYVATNRNRW